MIQNVNLLQDINDHLISFAKAFIVKDKMQRWTDLLSRRLMKMLVKSSEIIRHLE